MRNRGLGRGSTAGVQMGFLGFQVKFRRADMIVILVHGISHIGHIMDMSNKKRK